MKQERKWEYPEENPYGECDYDGKVEVYYNMTSFLNDSEVQQIWSIVGRHVTEKILTQQAIKNCQFVCMMRLNFLMMRKRNKKTIMKVYRRVKTYES